MTKKSISFQPRGRWVYGGMEKGRRDYLGNTPTKKFLGKNICSIRQWPTSKRKKDVPSLIGCGAAIKRLSSRLPISVSEQKRFPRKKLN